MDGMRNRKVAIGKGFTLVELLVVIAVIALLMSILMPALGRAKKQAMAAGCQMNLHQWALAFAMFVEEHDGRFMKSYGTRQDYWIVALLPYIGVEESTASEARKLFLCPRAAKSLNPDNCTRCLGTTFSAWGPFGAAGAWWDTGAMGSYGINEWCANPDGDAYWGFSSKYAWRTPDVPNANKVPVFLDCLYVDGYPMHDDDPPLYPEVAHESGDWAIDAIQLYCIDRHNGGINGLFMDWSVRKVGLKELWKLKWHRMFDTSFPPPVWESAAPWMRKFKDY